MDRLTAVLAKRLIRTEHVGLPNLVLGRRAVPELLQDQLTPERLVAHLQRLWDGPKRDECLASLDELRAKLGAGGAVKRIADALREELGRGRRHHTVL
jgi:lipid-A-disaccharide synthase